MKLAQELRVVSEVQQQLPADVAETRCRAALQPEVLEISLKLKES